MISERLVFGYNNGMMAETRTETGTPGRRPGAELRAGTPEARSEAARLMGRSRSPAKLAAQKRNAKKGGRKLKRLADVRCTCGAGAAVDAAGRPLHPTTCPRGRVVRYHLCKGLPLT